MSLRERNKQDKWRRIAAAAWDVFRERGYEAATTREIAARAEVATGTLFLYARDKRELVIKLFDARLGEAVAAGFAALPPDGRLVDDLVRIFGGFFALYAQAPDLARVFVKEVQFLPAEQRGAMDEQITHLFARLAERLARAQAAGEVDPALAPAAMAPTLFVLYYGALTGWLSGRFPREEAVEVHLRASFELLLRGLAPKEGR